MVLKKNWGRIGEELLLWFWNPTKGNQHSMTSNLSQLDKNDDHPRGHVKAPEKACHISNRKCLIFFFFSLGSPSEGESSTKREGRRGGRAVGMEGGAAVEARRR